MCMIDGQSHQLRPLVLLGLVLHPGLAHLGLVTCICIERILQGLEVREGPKVREEHRGRGGRVPRAAAGGERVGGGMASEWRNLVRRGPRPLPRGRLPPRRAVQKAQPSGAADCRGPWRHRPPRRPVPALPCPPCLACRFIIMPLTLKK